jgi:DNA-binding NarL/FixJ family response regulator
MRRHLEPAVHSLMQGGVFLCPEAQAQLFAAFGRNLIMEPSKKLTERETQLVTWLIQGASHKQIAREMGIAPATVHVHLCNVYGKTGTHSRQELLQKLCGDGEPV